MKNKFTFASLLASFALAPIISHAAPIGVTEEIFCPYTQGSSNVITNFGNYIAGYGVANLLSQKIDVYFKSSYFPEGVPSNLSNYLSQSANYDSTTGKVSCTYTSNKVPDPDFTVSYTIVNGKGG